MQNKHERLTTEKMLLQYKRHVKTLADGSLLIPLGRGLFDIFTGKEWLNHSRYRYANYRWIYLSGIRLESGWVAQNLPDLSKKLRLH